MVHVEWVDESVFPEKLQIARLESDSYQIQLSGVPGRSYNIEWTDNLQTPERQLLTNATPSQGGSFETIDVPPPGTSARFYRMIQP